MKLSFKYICVILVCLLLLCTLVSCGWGRSDVDENDAHIRSDYTSVYSVIGKNITVDMVEEDEWGLAFVEYEGVRYELGMDFLSMAMVYNTAPISGSGRYESSEDVYNEWWRLYIQRWNRLVPEVPLYSNKYYDIYNSKLVDFVTTPYRTVADAIVSARVKSGYQNSAILGSSTALTGAFRSSSWGKSSPGSADREVESLVSGYSTVMTSSDGGYVWNTSALDGEPAATRNPDGTLTYLIRIRKGLKFSDGSAITAENYIAGLVGDSTPVAVAAGGKGSAGLTVVGYEDFRIYDGSGEGSRYFEGVRLINDYSFSVTFSKDYTDYYYLMSYAAFTPAPLGLYLGDASIVTDEQGRVGLSDDYYRTVSENGITTFAQASVIKRNLRWDSPLPYSGPYTVRKFDSGTLVATLVRNPYYLGDDVRGKPSIDTITYLKVESETQMDKLRRGEIDVIGGITGGTATTEALRLVAKEGGRFSEVHYDRAGYGKLGFRCDFGPTSFAEVRRAIMYTVNRPEFAVTFTGGFGSVVHGPYYTGYTAYLAVKDRMKLNRYTFSSDSAIAELEAGGWIYGADGSPYTDGVRYKRLSGYELTRDNIIFKSTDGRYRTVKAADGYYYMPLVINWYGTQPNEVTDQLITSWQTKDASTDAIGMYITYTSCDFTGGLYAEYMQSIADGFDGIPKLNAINFATGFEVAAYDYSFGWTIDPELYSSGYSVCYLMDEADFITSYKKEGL